jgi:hypothetical protein
MPEMLKPDGKAIVIFSVAATPSPPAGTVNAKVWFELSLGAEFESVSLIDVRFAASAVWKKYAPTTQVTSARARRVAIPFSTAACRLRVYMYFLYKL